MSSAGVDLNSFRFSTRDLPPKRRLTMWNDAAASRPLPRRILSPPLASEEPFHVEMAAHTIGGPDNSTCVIRMGMAAGGRAYRTRELLSDGNDDVILHVHRKGGRVVSQLGREATIGVGAGLLTSNADASTIVLPGPAHFISVAIPRKSMKALAPGVEDAFLRPLPPDTSVLRVLVRYLDILDDELTATTPELRHTLAAHIHDLCALAIGAARDTAEIARGRGLRAARLNAVKTDIAEHLGEAKLRATAIALRQGITPRYIHKLFEGEGTTLSRFLCGQRLTRVHRRLTDPRHDHQTIGSLAYEAGFGDLSTFNREFRRHFGMTPSDVRLAQRAERAINLR